MQEKKKKVAFDLWEVIIIAFVSALLMSGATGYAVFRNSGGSNTLSNNPHLNEFISSYKTILNEFYADIDEEELIRAALSGMMNYLGDPYSSLLDDAGREQLLESLRGTFNGVGISLTDDPLVIDRVFRESPAQKAGILVGDIIKKIDGVSVEGKKAFEIAAMIRESSNKSVSITISRNGIEHTISITKGTILIPLNDEIIERNNKRVGYIQFSLFTDRIYDQFKMSLEGLEKEGIDSLIIDLRNNTGGYLSGVPPIASMFLKRNDIIYSLRNRLEITHERVKTPSGNRSYPIIVLINGNTASAGEVLAAALKYSYGAILVGETSHGKGKVQNTSDLPGGSMLKFTTAEWLTPKGYGIDGVGLKPDIEVQNDPEFGFFPPIENDLQLQRALNRITR